MYQRSLSFTAVALLAAGLAAGCADDETPEVAGPAAPRAATVPAPAELKQIAAGGRQLTLFPYTSNDLGQTRSDPINLVFRGAADPRGLRAALLALDGNRQAFGFPAVFPFTCTWSDALGDVQSAYAEPGGHTASVIQLQCGTYGPIRFHLRFFPAGEWTLANAHFEVVIPGTAEHQVLSWELAEQLVVVDFVRSGLLATSPTAAPALNQAPGFRTIPAVIYNSLPPELKAMIGGPASTSADLPIATNGAATILTLASLPAPLAGPADETLTIAYDQVFPRPFCAAGPLDYVHVTGPVTLVRSFMLTPSGNVVGKYNTTGTLRITPINPLTGERGVTATAEVADEAHVLFGDRNLNVSTESSRREIRADGSGSSLFTRLQVGGNDKFTRQEQCN